jgi:Cu/Ag efflux pump CusA
VDDAIIDVENILRRLRQNAARRIARSKLQSRARASLEVRSAVVYASVIIVLVFVPVFFLPGLAGTFFKPLALSRTSSPSPPRSPWRSPLRPR